MLLFVHIFFPCLPFSYMLLPDYIMKTIYSKAFLFCKPKSNLKKLTYLIYKCVLNLIFQVNQGRIFFLAQLFIKTLNLTAMITHRPITVIYIPFNDG